MAKSGYNLLYCICTYCWRAKNFCGHVRVAWSVVVLFFWRPETWGQHLSHVEASAHSGVTRDVQQWWIALHGLWIVSNIGCVWSVRSLVNKSILYRHFLAYRLFNVYLLQFGQHSDGLAVPLTSSEDVLFHCSHAYIALSAVIFCLFWKFHKLWSQSVQSLSAVHQIY